MKNSFWNKRIPTLLGLFVITLSLVATTILLNSNQILQSNASVSSQPKDVRITNVTDSSFTVSYTTDSQVSGSINYGKDINLGQSVLDDRDKPSGNLNNYNIHFITVKSLSASTKYYFTIISGQETYTTNNLPFEVTTAPPLIDVPKQNNSAKGQLKLTDGSPAVGALIYITTGDSQVLSTLSDNNGGYLLPLSQLRKSDLSSYYSFLDNSVIKILATNNLSSSNAVLYYSQVTSVPLMVLSENYDFRSTENITSTPSASLENFPSFTSTSSGTPKKDVKILSPQNQEGLTDQTPLFKGTALPKENVQIIIHSSQAITANVSTDTTGSWSFTPTTPLSPGNHTVTIIAKDASGILRTITQSFVVYAAGTDITPTVTPVDTLTLSPTPTDVILDSTASGSISPTQGPLPPTGNPAIITAGIIGVFVSLIGGLLFLLTRGGI